MRLTIRVDHEIELAEIDVPLCLDQFAVIRPRMIFQLATVARMGRFARALVCAVTAWAAQKRATRHMSQRVMDFIMLLRCADGRWNQTNDLPS